MAKKRFQPFRSELSINDIRASAWNATQGSVESYKKLQKENRRLAKIANSRMRQLEKEQLNMFSYDRVYTYLQNIGKTRFSVTLPDAFDYKGIVTQLQELVHFVNSKTSTVAGARDALNAKMDQIEKHTGRHYDYEDRIKIGKLLSTDSVSTLLREVRGDSGKVIEIIEKLALEEADTEKITSIIDRHLAGYNPFEDNPFLANMDYLSYDDMMFELRRLYSMKG